jgi:uncharacterized protein (TIGR00730 family)
VFAGSGAGEDPRFAAAARELGAELAARDLELVFGGESLGLMGAVADGTIGAGGTAIAVIPRFLHEIGTMHAGAELRLVDTLSERKQLMSDLSVGFIALPGGLGTLDELTEMVTWTQLGVHDKSVVILDVAGAWSPLATLLDTMVANGFLRPEGRALLRFETEPAAAIAAFAAFAG